MIMEALAANHFGLHSKVLQRTTLDQSLLSSTLGPHDVLLQVMCSDLNPVDLQKLQGPANKDPASSPLPVPNPPLIPGYGGSGIIQQIGDNVPSETDLVVGLRVAFLGDAGRNWGSYATHVVVDYRCVASIPANVDIREAATVPLAGCTAYEALVKLGLSSSNKITTGCSLLIVGGAGGVGSWATRLARAWHPSLNIIVTASSPESQTWCRQGNGANQVIGGHDQILQHLAGGREGSVDFILCLTEPIPTLFDALAQVIRPYGTICLVVAGDAIRSLDLSFCFFKAVTVTTETVFSSIRTNFVKCQPAKAMTDMLGLLSTRQIQAPLSPLLADLNEDWATALEPGGLLDVLKSGHVRGKLVMRIGSAQPA